MDSNCLYGAGLPNLDYDRYDDFKNWKYDPLFYIVFHSLLEKARYECENGHYECNHFALDAISNIILHKS